MPLSPTDFYAYSRATGAPVAETPEERARQAPDVYAFRQSQLQAPQQSDQGGFNVLDALGKTALAAGALAGGLGLYGHFRGKGLGQAVEGAVINKTDLKNSIERQAAARSAQAAKTTAQARQPVQRVANIKLDRPYGENSEYLALFNERGFPIDLKLSGPTPSPQRAVAQVAAESKPNLGVQVTNLNTPTEVQSAAPATQERMVRRQGRMVPLSSVSSQARPTVRSSQSFLTDAVQPSEEILDRLVADSERQTATNIAGQQAGETMVDQHNTKTVQHAYQSVSAINSSEDQVTGRSIHALQQNPDVDMSQVGPSSGFNAFSQRATEVGNWNKSVKDMWDLEAMMEDLGQQNQALQVARAKPLYTANDLLGVLPGQATVTTKAGTAKTFTKNYLLSEFSDSAAQDRAKLNTAVIGDRIMAAGSATPREAQMLLNPDVPTSDVRNLLGSTLRGNAAVDFHSNPTYEMRSYGQMGPTDAERFSVQRLSEENGPAAAQEYLAERLGGAGVITGLRERNNPEYDALLHGKLIPHWDELHGADQLVARNSPVTAEDVRKFNLNPERMHSNMTFNERKQLLDELPGGGGYEGARHRQTGEYLSQYAGYLGLNDVSPTIVEAGQGKPLIETRGFVERTNTGKTFIPGEVQQTKGSAPGSERFERSSEDVTPMRVTRSGEESRGVYATNDPNRPFRLVPTEVTGSKLVGGYEIPEATPHFMVGPAVPGVRNATSVAIKDMGQMVPVVHLDNETVPINRFDQAFGHPNQIGLLAPEGRHDPGSDVLRIQPYMVGDLVETNTSTQVVPKAVYGPLMQRTSEGLTPTAIDLAKTKQVAKDAAATWRSDPNAKMDYLANTGNQSDIDYLNSNGYEVGQVATGEGTTRNVVTGMRVKTDLGKAERDSEGFIIPSSVTSNVTPVNELGEPYHQTGYIADQLHQHLNASRKVGEKVIPGVDLPVLQDPGAKHHFVNDLLNVTTERDVYGSPYLGYPQNKTNDPLNVGRYARKWNEEKEAYETNVIPGMRRQQGLSGVDPMQYEDAGEAAELGTNVAFLTPRVNTAPQRVQGSEAPPNPAKVGGRRLANALMDHKQRTGEALSSENAVGFASSIAQQEGTDVNSVLNEANKYSQSIGKTSEWSLISKSQADEANFTRKYAPYLDLPTAPEQANLQQAAARTIASSVPDARQQAGVQHLANYISAAAKRKGVGNNALMPYSPPSEGMIQALMTQARRR